MKNLVELIDAVSAAKKILNEALDGDENSVVTESYMRKIPNYVPAKTTQEITILTALLEKTGIYIESVDWKAKEKNYVSTFVITDELGKFRFAVKHKMNGDLTK